MFPIVYLNGQYLPKEQAALHVADLAILLALSLIHL